jgi:hypothetical protein
MRKTPALCLLLLAGCASAQTEPARPGPVITRIPLAAEVNDTVHAVKVQPARVTVVGACHTGDRMPTARNGPLDRPSATIPTAPALGSLPYIPNACPVTVGPLAKPSVPVVYPKEEPRQ